MPSLFRPVAEIRPDVLNRLGVSGPADTFTFGPVTVHGEVVELHYQLDGVGELTETFTFAGADVENAEARADVRAALELLQVCAAVSYIKATIPPLIDAGPVKFDHSLRALLAGMLDDGLGEFAYENGLDLADWFVLPAASGEAEKVERSANTRPANLPSLQAGPLVPIGGGKDSIVTLEALRDLDPTLFAVNPKGPITRTFHAAGLPTSTVTRTLDPKLFDLNDRGALNGHVPVTAIVSAAATVAALLGGHGTVAMSNEGSADEPTLVVEGRAINHQWSKSLAFETMFRRVVADRVHPDLTYASFLRPATEIAVAARFSAIGSYDAVFNSCNRAFHLIGQTREWCGHCPKCRFVSLVLAPFMSVERLTGIVGRDILDDPNEVDLIAALAGLREAKPFECVGEERESLAAIAALLANEQWRDHAVLNALSSEVSLDARALEPLLGPFDSTSLPDDLRKAFDATF